MLTLPKVELQFGGYNANGKMADVESKSSNSNNNILYDLSVLTDWKFENELFTRTNKEKVNKSFVGRTSSLVRRSTWTLLRSIGIPLQTPTPCLLPEHMVRWKNCQNGWKMAVSSSGNYFAVAQEHCIEIRHLQDGVETLTAQHKFPPDPYPKWRCVAWSGDETMVACSRSCGSVDVCNTVRMLFTIPGPVKDDAAPLDLSHSIAALIFTDFKPKDKHWSCELLVISYNGSMTSYLLDGDTGCKQRYTFVLATEYPRGVASVAYDSSHQLLFVGGLGLVDPNYPSQARREGITAWRILSDAPYCKLVTDYHQDSSMTAGKAPLLSRLKISSVVQFRGAQVDGIVHLCLSPCHSTLVSLHSSGKLSVWSVPSLRIKKEFPLVEQPDWEDLSPEFTEIPTKRKRLKDLIPHKQLVDVNFWSNELLILARCTGAVSVASPDDLINLLGKSPEWFEPSPQLTQAHNGAFLGLECEIIFPKKRIIMSSPSDEEIDESDDEDVSFLGRSSRLSKQVMYYLTDSPRFEPAKRKPRYVTKIQRVVLLRSTTPEELYARKIEDEEYGEALALAQAYGLDCDLVYQRQWRKSEVSYASIQDYLSKISKRSWVMHECLERVPDNLDAMKELLEYGLHGTDLPALVAIGKGEDGGRFILCDPDEGLYEEMYDEFDPQSLREKEEKRAQIHAEWLEQVDFDSLNLEQKELCRARLKFLQYLDRLKTYECILGGENAASERFNVEFYSSFRSRSIYHIAAEYAQDNDWKALETLMTFHSHDLAPHRLALLSNFPETADPSDYKSLLPEIGQHGVEPLETDMWREEDWVESPQCWKVVALDINDESKMLYHNFSEKYRTTSLHPDLVEEWYSERACDIESRSRLLEYAIQLVKEAMERGAHSLSGLLDNLLTMEVLVYDCRVDNSISFQQLQDMADYDRLELIMSKSSEEMYVKHLHQWMVPFLQRCDQKEPGAYDRLLRDFILTKARNGLNQILKIFQASKVMMSNPVIETQEEVMSLALDSIYICDRDDQLDVAVKIVECLPVKNKDPKKESSESLKLHKQTDHLENHISAAKIFNHYDMTQTISSIKASEIDPDASRSLMIKLTRMATKRSLPMSELEWHKLHDDVMELQAKVYKCISRNACHEIFVESLLCSGKQDTIRLAGQMLERSCTETKPSRSHRATSPSVDKVTYTKAVDLTLSAAREYFDSSADLNDPCMDLARSCLHLIIDTPPPIQEELDLIAALPLLNEFGVSVLPLQVRLCKNRSDFVKTAVVMKPTSYKQTQRLIQLSQRLGIQYESVEEREGFVYKLAAEAAVTAMDYEFAYQCCDRLVSMVHSPAWTVCVRLAQQEAFRDIHAKAKLLSFAVTYCNNNMIKPVLQARCLLETQILYDQINKSVQEGREQDVESSSSTRESPFSARAAIQQTQQILSSTRKTTTAVISTVTDAKWWHSAVASLKQPQSRKQEEDILRNADDGNKGFKKQGCHPFYAGIIDDCYENWRSCDYTTMTQHSQDPAVCLSNKILRAANLEGILTEGEERKPSQEALLELAKDTLPKDAALGLAFLMAVPDGMEASSCFDDIPSTDISLQLALYYHSLNVFRVLKPCYKKHVNALYRHSPAKAIQRVVDYVMNAPSDGLDNEWPQEVKDMVLKVKNYHEILEDYKQACTLQGLGKGVDVVRFADDPDYKRETIFGLAMSLEDDVYEIAVSLANRYSIPLWDVYMCHLEFLFSDCKSMKEVESRVMKLEILPTLKSKRSEFTSRMMSHVYPLLAGTDLAGLAYFFSVLAGETDGEGDSILAGMTPLQHCRLVKKLKPACPGLDYKHLMESDESPSDILQAYLTASNINNLVKLAPHIPDKHGGFLQASALYSSWAVQKFWAEEEGVSWPNSTGWVQRYEGLGDLTQKLLPEDLIRLVDGLVFTHRARDTLDIACRTDIVHKAWKFSKHPGVGKKKKLSDTGEMKWDVCSSQLQSRQQHLKSLSSDTIQSFAQAEDPVFSTYAMRYDLSKGDIPQIELLLVQMVLHGQAIELVEDVLQIAPPNLITAKSVLQQAVTHISKALRGQSVSEEISVHSSWLSALEMVVENVREHQDNEGDLVQQEDVMSLLRSFCSDSAIEVKPRLDVLQVLEKSFSLSETDRVLLTLYRTNALVSSTWPNITVSEDNVCEEEARLQLFSRLLSHSSSSEQYICLSRILVLWPQFAHSPGQSPQDGPWVQVFSSIIQSLDNLAGGLIDHIVKDLCREFPLDTKCCRVVSESLREHNHPISSIKLLLRCPDDKDTDSSLTDTALQLLASQTQAVDDPDLLQLLVCDSNKLCARVVSMPVFPHLMAFVLDNENQDDKAAVLTSPTDVARQLMEAGFEAEAGSLLLQAQSSHSLLQTFGSALLAAGHWLKK